MNDTGAPLLGLYNLRLIVLSVLIAIFASYVARAYLGKAKWVVRPIWRRAP